MNKIVRMNGYVYFVEEHDAYGKHKTITNLGKDPDDPRWKEETDIPKQKKKKTKKDTD